MSDVRELWDIQKLTEWDKNPREINKKDFERLTWQIKKFGQYKPLIVTPEGVVLGGNMRLKAYRLLGTQKVWVSIVKPKDENEKLEYALSDNDHAGIYDEDALANLLPNYDIEWDKYAVDLGYPTNLQELLKRYDTEGAGLSLQEQFGAPPFSVLDARQEYWQKRKDNWLKLGIQSELGRGGDLTYGAAKGSDIVSRRVMQAGGGTSVFDPVLCELAYKWFNIDGGKILDPFAGGSVRGVVAGVLDYPYTGIELSDKQVEANAIQAKEIFTALEGKKQPPTYIQGDSNLVLDGQREKYDLIFTCPPYGDLEKYSDNKADLSNMAHDDFLSVYNSIIKKSLNLLRDDRFAVIVVGDYRDGQGFYRNFISKTIEAFQNAGATLYNEAIYITPIGSLPLRVGRPFRVNRKLGKAHQQFLVFYKGSPEQIKENYKEDVYIKEEEEVSEEAPL